MLVADCTVFIHQQQGGDAPQFEEIPFLAVEIGDGVFGVGQAKERQSVFGPITAVGVGAVGANGEDFRVTRRKGRIVIAQAGEMSAAMRSHKSAQEDQDDIFLAAQFCQMEGFAFKIGQGKIGGGAIFFHGRFLRKSTVARVVWRHCSSGEMVAGLSPGWGP